jgi:hypothetical protein
MRFCRSVFEEPFINSPDYSGVVFLTGMSASSLIGTSMFYLLHFLAKDKSLRILGVSGTQPRASPSVSLCSRRPSGPRPAAF